MRQENKGQDYEAAPGRGQLLASSQRGLANIGYLRLVPLGPALLFPPRIRMQQSVMCSGSPLRCHGISPVVLTFLGLLTIIGAPPSRALPQTAATGALIGEVLDPTGKRSPGASVELKNQEMGASRSTVSDEEGRFVFTVLPPGSIR